MIVDFTHLIDNGISSYSKEEEPRIKVISTIEENKYEARKIELFTHTGTHMDAPKHMLSEGKYLDEYPMEKFIGEAIVIDLEEENNIITVEKIQKYREFLSKVDFILIKTGWSKYWCTEKYLQDYPVLSNEAAMYLSNFNIKGIGIDCISIAAFDSEIKMHKIFLNRDILILENLKLDVYIDGVFQLVIAPLKIKNSDGAPIRVFGII